MHYSIGFVMATGMLHATGIGIGVIHRWSWGRVALTGAALGLPAAAHAHLVNTGLGPFYDGISHFALTAEDVLPALALALLAGLALVVMLRAPWARIAVRVAGSWIAAIGLLLLGWSLRAA